MNEVLQIGSVVELIDGEIPFMIIGYYPYDQDDDRVYDYLCVSCFLGIQSADNMLMIDRSAIKNVVYHGYQNANALAFVKEITNISKTQDIKQAIRDAYLNMK